jgi:HD superfamily phosphohydrolase
MGYKRQRIRDPLHSVIGFEANEFEDALWSVIQTRPFQRLRRIKQLGFSDLVYPGATHSRFIHSIGAFHTARQLMRVISRHLGDSFAKNQAERALAAALVHDLGHGPFSHAFEAVGERLRITMAKHENVSDALIRDSEVSKALDVLGTGFSTDVANIIERAGPKSIYGAVVSSQFDADRLDYMRRDRLMTGTQLGAIDFDWLLENLEVGSLPYGVDGQFVSDIDTFVLGPKAIYAAETYVVGLFQLYPTVYFHKTTRSAEKIFSELLLRTIKLVKKGSAADTGLQKKHPLIRFATKPNELDRVLCLDDSVIWGALSIMIGAKDSIVSEFATRLRDRKLLKCMDVRERLSLNFGQSAEGIKKLDKSCASIGLKMTDWISKKKGRSHRVLVDEGIREPYKLYQESKGPLNQIIIKTSKGGPLVDLGELSKVVKAIDPFKFFRIYVSEQETEAIPFIEKIVKEEIRK